jgi:hypothetical protein
MAELVKGMEGLTVTTPAEVENITGAFTKEDMDAFQEVTSALRKLELTEPGITAHDVRELVCQHHPLPRMHCTRSHARPLRVHTRVTLVHTGVGSHKSTVDRLCMAVAICSARASVDSHRRCAWPQQLCSTLCHVPHASPRSCMVPHASPRSVQCFF